MHFLICPIISTIVLITSYRVVLLKTYIVSIVFTMLILISHSKMSVYEVWCCIVYINIVPVVVHNFRKDFDSHKEDRRARFEEVKLAYEDLAHMNTHQIESNLERDRRGHNVLALYESSKDMSACLLFENIFNIFNSTLKKAFRFKISRCLVLKDSKEIESVYQIGLGHSLNKVVPDDFDRELINTIFERKEIMTISVDESPQFKRLSVVKGFETLIVVPLFVEEKITGVLSIENIPRMQFENFIILAGQFAGQFQRVMLYKKVQEMSVTDSLSELYTRRYFLERFEEEIKRSMRHKSGLSLLMLDIDHFKEKNDRFGHLVGDVVLKEIAGILKSNLREIDIMGRYGGEEFAIVLSGLGRDEAFYVGERIRKNIEETVFKAYDEVLSNTVSIGISVFPEDGVNVHNLIESADRALYKAKESGRNRVC